MSAAEIEAGSKFSPPAGEAAGLRKGRVGTLAIARSERHDEDLRLMRLCAAGDRAAQRLVANRLVDPVYRVARHLLAQPSDAEDAAQSCLVQVLRRADTFRGECRLEVWAERIAVRTTLRQADRERARLRPVASEIDVDQLPRQEAGDDARESLPAGLWEYLARLPATQRTVLVLRHLLDYSLDEIAKATSASPNTVKDRLQAARRAVRRMIRRDLFLRAARGGEP